MEIKVPGYLWLGTFARLLVAPIAESTAHVKEAT
jgi:hypothetical protein